MVCSGRQSVSHALPQMRWFHDLTFPLARPPFHFGRTIVGLCDLSSPMAPNMQLVPLSRVKARRFSKAPSTVVEGELATEITRAHLRLVEQVDAQYRPNALENAFGHLSSICEANLARSSGVAQSRLPPIDVQLGL